MVEEKFAVVEGSLTNSSAICNQEIPRAGGDSRKASVDLGSEDKFSVKGELGTRTIVLRQILQ